MAEARRRDRIAGQYASAYRDVSDRLPRLAAARRAGGGPAVSATFLAFLSVFPTAMSGANSASTPPGRLPARWRPRSPGDARGVVAGLEADLLKFDAELKAAGSIRERAPI
jgi:hypothetical protein